MWARSFVATSASLMRFEQPIEGTFTLSCPLHLDFQGPDPRHSLPPPKTFEGQLEHGTFYIFDRHIHEEKSSLTNDT